jgi:hypothetical protein
MATSVFFCNWELETANFRLFAANENGHLLTVRTGARIKYKLMGFMVYF